MCVSSPIFIVPTVMLAYPHLMQRHPHFAAAAISSSYPQALPAFPQFSSAAVTSPPMPMAAFALQAQIPSPMLSPSATCSGTQVTVNSVKQSGAESGDHDSSSSKKNECSNNSSLNRRAPSPSRAFWPEIATKERTNQQWILRVDGTSRHRYHKL